ncbi:MAG: hypothetical protein ACETVR_04400 [Candidatus Bathyarchaeia archaeon]
MDEVKVLGGGCSKKEGKYIITIYKDAEEGKLNLKIKEKDSAPESQKKDEP